MPTRADKTKRERDRGRKSDLDWFAEDPWSDPNVASFEDSQDDREPDLWGSTDEDLDESLEDWDEGEEEDLMDEDDYDGWGPVRRRTKQRYRD
jgi:hypothetical protein